MLRYFLKQIVSGFILILAVVLVTFVLFELSSGDPVQAMVGKSPVTDELREQMIIQFGLDRPFHERLGQYVLNFLTGDLGYSYANNRPVMELILERLGATLLLAIPALVLTSLIGLLIGSVSASTRSRALDGLLSYFSVAALSTPAFWLGLLLILLFSVQLGWLPAGGINKYGRSGISVPHMILPVTVLVINELAFNARIMRSTTLEVLGQDYMVTARSKGLSRHLVLRRHALPNSMMPQITVIGFSLGYTLAGAVIVERVFGWPGMGLLLLDAVRKSENQIVAGVLVVTTITVVIANILTDMCYGMVDPRIRKQFREASGRRS